MDFASISKLSKNDFIIMMLVLVIVALGVVLVDHMAKLDHAETQLKNKEAFTETWIEYFCDYKNQTSLEECRKFGSEVKKATS